MVCERNVDTWRRAAFFEETGETYRRVISVCLRPLEQLALNLGAGLESSLGEKSAYLSDQLRSPTDRLGDSRLHESFNDFQVIFVSQLYTNLVTWFYLIYLLCMLMLFPILMCDLDFIRFLKPLRLIY